MIETSHNSSHAFAIKIKDKLKEVFALDLRSLALFRISAALILLFDLLNRSKDLVVHYTDVGLMPRSALIANYYYDNWFMPLHFLSGNSPWQVFLFVIAVAAAVMLLFGYKTRLATVLSWLLIVSIHARNPFIVQGGDILLRVALFWAMFLPWGARWSLDSARRPTLSKTKAQFSAGTLGYVLQIASVYFFAVLLKTGSEWLPDGTAVYYSLSIDGLVRPLGTFFLNFPTLLMYLAFATIFLEFITPFLLLSPLKTPATRMWGIITIVLLHVGFATMLVLGPFPWVGVATALAFLPSAFWNRISKKNHSKNLGNMQSAPAVTPVNAVPKNPEGSFSLLNLPNIIAFVALLYVFFFNMLTLVNGLGVLNREVRNFGAVLGLNQQWLMFAPRPMIDDGWYVFEGERRDGKLVDVLKGTEGVLFEKPAHLSARYKSERWRKFFVNYLHDQSFEKYRPYYARYLCEKWNTEHVGEEKLRNIELIFMEERTLPNYQYSPPVFQSLLKQSCES